GVEPRIGPLATAYVLLLVILGPVTARWTEPLTRRLTRRPWRTAPDAVAADQVEVARAKG
ncbi:cation:proton antiporter, partial [Streptomyces sp. NPDC001508]